jgi:replicative DNA helicase
VKPRTDDTFRRPPCDLEAERGLLGSVVLMFDCLDEVALIVSPEDFYLASHGLIFEHLLALREAGKKFDLVLLTDRMKASGDYETVGGGAELAKLINYVPNAAHAISYAEIVRDHATRRGMIQAATDILAAGYDPQEPIGEYMAKAEASIFSAGNRCQTLAGATDINASVLEALANLDRRRDGKALRGVSTGLHGLDNLTGGFQPGEVTILAGRTSMGKTAMALGIVRAIADEHPVLLFSMEMDSLSMSERLLSMVARVNLYRMRAGTIGVEGRGELVEAAGAISQMKLRIDDKSGRTVSQIASICRRQQRREGIGLVMIDYLQLLEPDNHKDPRHEQVAKISRRLKGLARELKIPLLVLAQLNRQTTQTKDQRPALSHLRESGAIEQDADVVVFCHRPAYYSGESGTGPERSESAELIVAKNRQGPTGKVDVLWHGSYLTYVNKADGRFAEDNKAKRVTAFDDYNERSKQEVF